MNKTLNEMVHTIVDYCGSITRAADEIGVHYNTLDRLLKDDEATVQTRTMEKIEAIYEEIAPEEEEEEEDWEEPEEEIEEKIEKLEVGKTYEIRIPKSKNGNVVTLLRGTVKGEYRQFYHLDDNGKNITVLKADLVNDRTTVTPIDVPAKEVEEPVDVEYVPSVDEVEEPEEVVEEEVTEEPAEAPEIQGETVAERLNYCLSIVYRCNKKIAEGEKAKKDKAAILPLMDDIYKEFRG